MQWESDHGHAHAALRYGLMSRPAPSLPVLDLRLEDERAEALRQMYLREKREENPDEEDFEDEFDAFPAWAL
jgi:hypothetical protein